eukprot:CAMPEP_0175083400 /NCGR_PEP_ID=MMETSP0052_2-20121109/27363_1 /TAXON_ID=51329 ORGANISM="Polytomella parva, Strain SAG 63-3" /NCGR_SAMPLE_ID=MMETSP0052_2 /ASSEMBLY_ACC=CAM_ASM_000194 /LENGTH=324 /DNA_ID=CAMNT_0016354849 /DNA_START=81 /DNA_END=1055 /DNA_ORIENTATION=+
MVEASLTEASDDIDPSDQEINKDLIILQLQEELDSLKKALHVINNLAYIFDIQSALDCVRDVAIELLNCESASIFLVFEKQRELRGLLPPYNQLVRIPFGLGAAGIVAATGHMLNLEDAYQCPFFNDEIDRLMGTRTKQMLCSAITDMRGKIVAVLQVRNRRDGQNFSHLDEQSLRLFGTHLGNTLTKAKLNEAAKVEKERVTSLYQCFKHFNAIEDLDYLFMALIYSMESYVVCSERSFLFLVDNQRDELWLQMYAPEPVRIGLGEGFIGISYAAKQAVCVSEFEDQNDPLLQKLRPYIGDMRVNCALAQPVLAPGGGGGLRP